MRMRKPVQPNRQAWGLALLAALMLAFLSASPRGARALTLDEMQKASRAFSDLTQTILQRTEAAGTSAGKAVAEMDAQAQRRPSPPELETALARIGGHLQAARERLQEAKKGMSRLSALYQRRMEKARKGRAAPSPTETEEDRRVLARYHAAYREAETRVGRAYERALYALQEAEGRFAALTKKAAGGHPPGN